MILQHLSVISSYVNLQLQKERFVYLWHDRNKRFLGACGGALREFACPSEETVFVLSHNPASITLKTKTDSLYIGEALHHHRDLSAASRGLDMHVTMILTLQHRGNFLI